jgi:hypothetical protein
MFQKWQCVLVLQLHTYVKSLYQNCKPAWHVKAHAVLPLTCHVCVRVDMGTAWHAPCRHLVQLIQEELAERDSHAEFQGLLLPLLQDEVRQQAHHVCLQAVARSVCGRLADCITLALAGREQCLALHIWYMHACNLRQHPQLVPGIRTELGPARQLGV